MSGRILIFSRDDCLAGLDHKLRAACEGDRKWNQFLDEGNCQVKEFNKLVEKIEKLKETNAESKQVKILELRQKVAGSKSMVALYQRHQRQSELEISQLQDDLKAATSHQERERIQHRLESVDGNLQSYKRQVHFWEERANQAGEELKQLDPTIKEEEKRQEKRQEKLSKKLLDDALKEGFAEVVIVVCIIVGQPGVGKTHVKYLLLDKRPPHLRSSTICAETPVRIEVRSVSGSRVQNIRGNWKEVSDEEMLDIVARMILQAEPQLSQKSEQGFFSKVARLLQLDSTGSAGAKLPTLDSPAKAKKKAKQPGTTTPALSDACQEATKEIMDKLLERIRKLKSGVDREGSTPGESSTQSLSEIVLNSKWIYFTDSGGQPQYHELLPLIVRSISSALCVTRLTDKLDETQEVEYYQDGKQVGAAQQSQLSAKDTIQCLVNTIQSYSSQEQPPKIIMVGTHLDKLEEASDADLETLEEKNKKLLEMLKPEFSDQLVYSSQDMKKLLFPFNALNPGEKEKKMAQSIRGRVEDSGAKKVTIPIWWYIMELLLQELARKLGRGVLSRAECLTMARMLGIREKSFNAALEFFDKLNVIKYSPDVLPDVVFIESQIPLDKVSELVYHNYLLRQPASAESTVSVDGEWEHFRDKGVVSKECLKQFDRHYVPEIFSVDDLSKFLKKLLVFAPIPRPDWAPKIDNPSNEDTHFVMPALLITLIEAELEKYRISSPELATLLVRFPHHSRRAGVFCCFIVHLIKHCRWNLLLNLSAEEPLYRNCIKMHLPSDPPCSVTLIDSNSLIEVYVRIAGDVRSSKCVTHLNVIKNAILSGISAACKALKYKETKPEFTFHCPHTQPSSLTSPADRLKEVKQHTATLNDNNTFLICDRDRENSYHLQLKHLVWLRPIEVSTELSPPATRTISRSNQSSSELLPPATKTTSGDSHSNQSSSELSPPATKTRSGDATQSQANLSLSDDDTSVSGLLQSRHHIWFGTVLEDGTASASPRATSQATCTSSEASESTSLHLSPPTPSTSAQVTSSASHLPLIPEYVSISSGPAEALNNKTLSSSELSPPAMKTGSDDATLSQASLSSSELSPPPTKPKATSAESQHDISSSKLPSPATKTSSSDAKETQTSLYSMPSGPQTQSMAVQPPTQSTPASASHRPHESSGVTEELNDMSKPNSSNLTVIRWKNERGEMKKFRLKSLVYHKWRRIGNLVAMRQQLAVWAKRMDDEECCEAVLSHWLDHPPRHYPATWEGLYELLDDSELGQVATELKQAVDNAI